LATVASAIRTTDTRYLVGPLVDFLLLGGASLIVLPLVAVLLPVDEFRPVVLVVTLALANVINHPHFACSYQIFYRNFRNKLRGSQLPASLRIRYAFAGIVVPLALCGFFLAAVAAGDAVLLGRAANLMAFLVGWHYVKQGYGMLMVDAVLKRNFFSTEEKRILIFNSYACWLATWLHGNRVVRTNQYFSLEYYTFDVPDALFYVAACAAAITSLLAIGKFAARYARDGQNRVKGLPLNGVMAYLTSVYLWMMFVGINPLMVLIVPAFHSLQYLFVVWRYQQNFEHSKGDAADAADRRPFGRFFRDLASYRLGMFALIALTLGYFGFWGAPELLDSVVLYDKTLFGSLFLFMFWIFINVHHYFIDSVIWKGTNPDVKKYLFEAR
jgi:hypothetical protein